MKPYRHTISYICAVKAYSIIPKPSAMDMSSHSGIKGYMYPEMVADGAKAFKPRVLYSYHYDFGETDTAKRVELMNGLQEVDLRRPYAK